MWLVLCDARDVSAAWAHSRLKARGLQPLHIISAEQLALSDFQEHRIDMHRATLRFRTEAGLQVDAQQLRGVLNRLYTVPIAHWRQAPQVDQDYVQQELVAFFLSWLTALPCPVINRPTPQGLCGQWRCESEWAWLARQAGLPVAPYRQSSRERIDEMKGERRMIAAGALVRSAIVAGDSVAGPPMPPAVQAACLRLARLASTELLGIDFVDGAAGAWTFAGASPTPELSSGGEPLVDALLRRLTQSTTHETTRQVTQQMTQLRAAA